MGKKVYTIYLFSNTKESSRSLRVPAAGLKLFVVGLSIVSILMALFLVDYAGLLLRENKVKTLKAENVKLKNQFSLVERKLEALEGALDRVRVYSKKLKLITGITGKEIVNKASSEASEGGEGVLSSVASAKRVPAAVDKASLIDKVLSPEGALSNEDYPVYKSLVIRIDEAVLAASEEESSVLDLAAVVFERETQLLFTPSIKPTNGWYSSPFGYRIDPYTHKKKMHEGLDIAANPGTPVVAVAEGMVSYVGHEKGYGKLVAIDHGHDIKTRFAHNSKITVKLGQKVSRGDVIALVGTTGRSSGPHLHYEVRVMGVPVNPENYILDEE